MKKKDSHEIWTALNCVIRRSPRRLVGAGFKCGRHGGRGKIPGCSPGCSPLPCLTDPGAQLELTDSENIHHEQTRLFSIEHISVFMYYYLVPMINWCLGLE